MNTNKTRVISLSHLSQWERCESEMRYDLLLILLLLYHAYYCNSAKF